MKMSQENYEKFKRFFDYTVETAGDREIEMLMTAITAFAAEATRQHRLHNKPDPKRKA